VVICLERGADLHTARLVPLTLTVSCFSKIQIGFAFLVPTHLGCPGQRAVEWVCVCVYFFCFSVRSMHHIKLASFRVNVNTPDRIVSHRNVTSLPSTVR